VSVSRRERWCGRVCVEHGDATPEVVVKRVDGVACAHYTGLLQCGHIWSCPVCSLKKRTKRAEDIAAAMRGVGGSWAMLTVTLRHRKGMALKPLFRGLAAAWRRCKQGGRIQRIWSERVTMSVRASEITYGDNGWHPHLHILIRTTAWTEDEKDALLMAWQRAIREVLGRECSPSDERAIEWSAPFDASDESKQALYIFKLGGELAGSGKVAHAGHVTHWEVAERAAREGGQWLRLWQDEFLGATRGRRMLELDDRCKAAAVRQLEYEASLKPHTEEDPASCTIHISLARDDVRALRMIEARERGVWGHVLSSAEHRGEPGVVAWVLYARSLTDARYPESSRPPDTPAPRRRLRFAGRSSDSGVPRSGASPSVGSGRYVQGEAFPERA